MYVLQRSLVLFFMYYMYDTILQVMLGQILCLCTAGYSGSRCERELLLCESSPCINGICVNQPGDFTCVCHDKYTGNSNTVFVVILKLSLSRFLY